MRKLDPDRAAEELLRRGFRALEPYPGVDEPWRSEHLECGKVATPTLSNLRRGGRGCRRCAPNAPVDPHDAIKDMRDAGADPVVPFVNTTTKWLSICDGCGELCNPTLGSIRQGQGPCDTCGHRRRAEKQRTPSAIAIAAMREAHLEPLEDYTNNRTPWLCLCMDCGAEVSPTLGNVRAGHGGCVPCAHRNRALKRRTDPSVAFDEMLDAGFFPLTDFELARAPWHSRCRNCNKESRPTLANVRTGKRCRHCAGNVQLDPDTAADDMVKAGARPLDPYINVSTPWRCECLTCKSTIEPRLADVRKTGRTPCGTCWKNRRAEGLRSREPKAVEDMVDAGATPLEPFPGVAHRWLCECHSCDREIRPRLNTVRNGSRPCVFCSPHGFNHTDPGRLYLFRHDGYHALKVGITNDGDRRLLVHEHAGWCLVAIWSFDVGADAYAIEQAVLDSWADFEIAVDPAEMHQGGYTETISVDDMTEAEAVELIEGTMSVLASTG